MKTTIMAAAAAAIALTGCAPVGPEVNPPQDPLLKAPQIVNSRIVGFTEPVIRSYVRESKEDQATRTASSNTEDSRRSRAEVTGIRCIAESAEFRTEVVTPGIVRLPIMKGRPTTLRMKCASGDYEGELDLRPQLNGVVIGGASVAGLVAAAVTAGVAASNDKWSYGANGIAIPIEVKKKAQ